MYTNNSVVRFKLKFLNTEITELVFVKDFKLIHPTTEEIDINLSVKLQEFIKRNVYTEIHHNGSNSYDFIAEIKATPDIHDYNYDGQCIHSISETFKLTEDSDAYAEFNTWLVNNLNIMVEKVK